MLRLQADNIISFPVSITCGLMSKENFPPGGQLPIYRHQWRSGRGKKERPPLTFADIAWGAQISRDHISKRNCCLRHLPILRKWKHHCQLVAAGDPGQITARSSVIRYPWWILSAGTYHHSPITRILFWCCITEQFTRYYSLNKVWWFSESPHPCIYSTVSLDWSSTRTCICLPL